MRRGWVVSRARVVELPSDFTKLDAETGRVKTGGRTDQSGQFDEGGKIYRGFRAHWPFTSPYRGRRGIKVAEEVHWIGNFRTVRE